MAVIPKSSAPAGASEAADTATPLPPADTGRVRGVPQLQLQGRERLAHLLKHAANAVLQEDLAAATFSPATLSMPLGEWLHQTGIELGVPIPREVAAFVQGSRVNVQWLPPPASPPVAETPTAPTGSSAAASAPQKAPPPKAGSAGAKAPPMTPQQVASMLGSVGGAAAAAQQATPPAVPQVPTATLGDLPTASVQAGSTAFGTGRYFLVLKPAAHVPEEFAGLYNRFGDYQRVVALQGSVLCPRSTQFDPVSESVRVETVAAAEAMWTSHGRALPIPRRFRP